MVSIIPQHYDFVLIKDSIMQKCDNCKTDVYVISINKKHEKLCCKCFKEEIKKKPVEREEMR